MTSSNYLSDVMYLSCVDLVLNAEGGYSDDPDDPGGPTNRGIAWNYQKNNLALMGVNTVKQLSEITKEFAYEFYYRFFWNECGANRIRNQKLAYIHFDAAVNHGIGQAGIFISKLSKDPRNFDGLKGKNKNLFQQLFLEYFTYRLRFYTRAKNRKIYLEGWVNRMVDLSVNSWTME